MSRHEMLRLLQACKDHPEDDAARLILADWLEEHGGGADRARARLIRLQVPGRLLAGLPDLGGEQKALARAHQEAWAADAAPLFAAMSGRNQSAGLDHVDAPHEQFAQRRLYRFAESEGWAWVEQVRTNPTAAVLRSPLLRRVSHLVARDNDWGLQCRLMAASPALASLRGLTLHHGQVPDDALATLVSSPHLQGLRELSLYPADPTGTGLACLEGRLPALVSLNLCGIPAGELPPQQLARVLARPGLRELDLRTTSLTMPHLRALSGVLPGLRTLWLSRVRRQGRSFDMASAAFAPGLEFLMLHEFPVTRAGYRNLGRLADGRLRALLLWQMGMEEGDVKALVSAGALGKLTVLDINRNRVGAGGALALARSGQEAPLLLEMSSCGLGYEEITELAAWPGLSRCRVLDLSENPLGERSLRALADSPHLTGLLELNVGGPSGKTGKGLAYLLRSPLMGRLESLRAGGWAGDLARLLRAGPELPRLRNLDFEVIGGLAEALAERCPNAHLE